MIPQPDVRAVDMPANRRSITGRWFRNFQRYTWSSEYTGKPFLGKEIRVHVPSRYEFDGGSVPRIAWSMSGLTPEGKEIPAWMIHDLLYDTGGVLPYGQLEVKVDGFWMVKYKYFNRKEADRLMLRILEDVGTEKRHRKWAYRMVRFFGGMGKRWGMPRVG